MDELTVARLLVREFIYFSASHPQLHRIITQECKTDGPRMDWLVERHIRPIYESTTAHVRPAWSSRGTCPPSPSPHLYYIVTGAGPTMFVLGPRVPAPGRYRPPAPEVVEAHADAVVALIFGPSTKRSRHDT